MLIRQIREGKPEPIGRACPARHKRVAHLDVIAGAAIGIASSYIFTRPYKGWQAQVEAGDKCYGPKLRRAWESTNIPRSSLLPAE
jgi:hypothetical protein